MSRRAGETESAPQAPDLKAFAALTLDIALPDTCIPGVQAALVDLAKHAERVRAFALPDPKTAP